MKGTYLFDTNDPDYDATTFGVLSTFLGDGITQVYGAPFVSFAIAGDAATSLTVTFTRAPSSPASSTKVRETQTVMARNGSAYTCDGGWLVGVPTDLHAKTTRHDQHGGAGPTYRFGTMGPQTARLRRDSEGGLVARTNVREPRVISVWAETGAGIPYWFDTNTYWARWRPVDGSSDSGDFAKINPKTMSKIKRQEYEMENGVGAYAATTAPEKPAAPFDIRAAVARHIDSNATLEDVRSENDRYVLTLRVTARGQVTRTMESLAEDTAFTDVQDHGIVAGGGQKDIAMISLKRR